MKIRMWYLLVEGIAVKSASEFHSCGWSKSRYLELQMPNAKFLARPSPETLFQIFPKTVLEIALISGDLRRAHGGTGDRGPGSIGPIGSEQEQPEQPLGSWTSYGVFSSFHLISPRGT